MRPGHIKVFHHKDEQKGNSHVCKFNKKMTEGLSFTDLGEYLGRLRLQLLPAWGACILKRRRTPHDNAPAGPKVTPR